MTWEVWSRYKTFDGAIFFGTREEAVNSIERAATFLRITNVKIQAETDQILSWTVDGSGRKRKFISMNAE